MGGVSDFFLGKIDSGKGPQPIPPPTIEKDGGEAAQREKERRRRAKGRGSTILTADLGPANTGRQTLGGA